VRGQAGFLHASSEERTRSGPVPEARGGARFRAGAPLAMTAGTMEIKHRTGAIGWVAAAAVLTACAGKESSTRAPERPGLPAYWESDIPREPARPPPGTRFEQWPLLNTGTPQSGDQGGRALEGTSDRFLWEEKETADAGVKPKDPQRPLRILEDGTEEENEGGGGR
jgi:hypothetical protein